MNLETPLISVIIPCYNVSEYVGEAIQSILKQTYKHLEIWIIDDASTDNTLEKIHAYKDERIIVEAFKKNTKKIGAVNEVLKKVKGDFICFQDADDWSELNRIQLQLEAFQKKTNLGVCFTNYCYIENTKKLPTQIALNNEELRDEFLNFGNKKNKSFDATTCATMMIAKDVLNKTNGYHPYFIGRVGEDIHWIYRILKEFEGITLKQTLYNYRIRTGSFTQNTTVGVNAKYAYSWQLISIIIQKDLYENIDLLHSSFSKELAEAELLACENALIEKIKESNNIQNSYKNSSAYKIGRIILSPLRFFK